MFSRLPAEYKEFLLTQNGGLPEGGWIKIPGHRKGHLAGVGEIYGLYDESKGFTLPSVFVVQGSRGRIAAALGLDIVVDDRPENCLDVVVDSKARAILVWREDEKLLPSAARRCSSRS